MVPNGTFREVSVSSSSQFPTLFPLGADFGGPPLMSVLALQSCDRCVYSGNILSVLPFPPPLPLLGS